MIEFTRHLDEYSNYEHSSFSRLVPSEQWGNRKLAEKYLQKYWLPELEYLSVWKPIQDKIFLQGMSLPDLTYHSDFELIASRGGCLFVEEDFNLLQKVMLEIGETHFVVIQHSQSFTDGDPMFRMKFPVGISWEELISGNYISAVLFEMSYNEYFVFSESGNFGKYSSNDYIYPLEIIGFKRELAPVFKEYFKLSSEVQEELREWLPEKYKKIIR